MDNINNFQNEKFKFFWQPFIITYTITVLIVIATCVIQYNFDLTDLKFYRIQLDNYVVFLLAKAAESLIPTTIVFALLSMLTSNDKFGRIKTCLVILVSSLAIFGFLQPTMKNIIGFWILLVLSYSFIVATLFCVAALLGSDKSIKWNKHKSEISDGQYSR